MARPYSIDLRTKIVEAYDNKEGSMEKLAKTFRVSKNFVSQLIKRYKETGSVEPKPHGGGHKNKIDGDDLMMFRSIVTVYRDATLEELRNIMEQMTGVCVSRATVQRTIVRLGITRKKNVSRRRKIKRRKQK